MGKLNVTRLATGSALAMALFSGLVAAGVEEEVRPCFELRTVHDRLACYDQASRQLQLGAVGGAVVGDTGDWKVKEWTSPVDDSANTAAVLASSTMIPDQLGIKMVRPALTVRCKEGQVEAYINWNRYLSTQPVRQLFRFDKQKAYSQEWSISTDYEALFAYRRDVAGFAAQIMHSDKLYVQVTPHGSNPVNTTFFLAGADAALLKVLKSCGL